MELKHILDKQTYEILNREYGLHDAYVDSMGYTTAGDSREKSNIKYVMNMTDYENQNLKIKLIFEEVWRVNYSMDLDTLRYEETNKPLFGRGLGQVDDIRVDYVRKTFMVSLYTHEDYRLFVSAKKFKIETEYVEK
ncbi:hypothetical protein ACVQ8P_02330 [Dellaglioa sp. BT-FLS60]